LDTWRDRCSLQIDVPQPRRASGSGRDCSQGSRLFVTLSFFSTLRPRHRRPPSARNTAGELTHNI
jgi:hypothetical protein